MMKKRRKVISCASLIKAFLLKDNLLTDDTCTTDDETAIVDEFIHVCIGENGLDACLRRIGRSITVVTPALR